MPATSTPKVSENCSLSTGFPFSSDERNLACRRWLQPTDVGQDHTTPFTFAGVRLFKSHALSGLSSTLIHVARDHDMPFESPTHHANDTVPFQTPRVPKCRPSTTLPLTPPRRTLLHLTQPMMFPKARWQASSSPLSRSSSFSVRYATAELLSFQAPPILIICCSLVDVVHEAVRTC